MNPAQRLKELLAAKPKRGVVVAVTDVIQVSVSGAIESYPWQPNLSKDDSVIIDKGRLVKAAIIPTSKEYDV